MDLNGCGFRAGFEHGLERAALWHDVKFRETRDPAHYFAAIEMRSLKIGWFREFHVTLAQATSHAISTPVNFGVLMSYWNVAVIFFAALVLGAGLIVASASAAFTFTCASMGYGRRWLSVFGILLAMAAMVEAIGVAPQLSHQAAALASSP